MYLSAHRTTSIFQADHKGSIPFARSTEKPQAKTGVAQRLDSHQEAIRVFSPHGFHRFCNSLPSARHPLGVLGLPGEPHHGLPVEPHPLQPGSVPRRSLMSAFVLIHGGFCRSWVWAETVAALEADGHRAEVVDLPSSGTVAADLGDLQADIATVRRTLDRTGTEIVLVAHSAGGMVLTEFSDHPSVQHRRMLRHR